MGIPVEGVPIIVKMAENRIRSGLISAEGMIDYIYTELGERFSKGDIRDALRKYGVAESTEPLKRKKAEAAPKVDPEIKRIETRVKTLNTMIDNLRKKIDTGDISVQKKELKTPSTPEIRELEKTRDELNATLNKMRKEAQPRKTTEEIKSKAYETRLQKQKAMLEGQLETGVFTKPEKTKLVLNEKQLGLKADVERLKTKIDDEIRKQDFQNMSGMDKFYHYTNKWRRAVILSSVTTLGKLTSAATQRFISTPMEELAGGILSHIPGISRIAKGAPREGGGMNFKAEAQALRHAFEKATWAASWETVKTGKGPLDYMFGKKNGLPPEALDLFGHMHGALKVFPKTAEFYRSFEKRAEWAARHGLDIKDPNVQMGIMADAYIDSNRAILMNDVLGNTLYRAAIGQAKNAGWAGKAGAFAGQIAVPIVKVPMNFVAETLNYALGTPKGVGQVIYYLINKGAFEKMTAFQKDNVMRSLKKGSLGLALLTIGYSNPEWFGGFYEPGEKRSPDEAKVGGVKVNFPDGTYWHIPRFLLHSPPLEVLQMGATIRRVSDKRDQVMDGMVASVRGIMERTPFFDQIWRGYASMASADKFGMAIAEFLRSMTIPPDSQNLAILLDPNGDEIRKPEDVKDVFKKSIPGLREDVPIKRSGGIQPMKPSKSMLKPMQPNR